MGPGVTEESKVITAESLIAQAIKGITRRGDIPPAVKERGEMEAYEFYTYRRKAVNKLRKKMMRQGVSPHLSKLRVPVRVDGRNKIQTIYTKTFFKGDSK